MKERPFSPADLFPPSDARLGDISTSCVAFTGPLPAASLLHLALNHLRSPRCPLLDDEDESLKDVPSAPLPDPHVLVLTSDRAGWRDALVAERDVTLFGEELEPGLVQLMDKIEFKHLPTSAHLIYFLTTAYTHESLPAPYDAFVTANPKLKADSSYLPIPPSLVILHDPSHYLAEDANASSGIEAYASLLALFTSSFAAFPHSPFLVLHDRPASTLDMPVIAPHRDKARRETRETNAQSDSDISGPRMTLETAIEYFFDCVGRCTAEPIPVETVFDDESLRKFSLCLSRSSRRSSEQEREMEGRSRNVVVEFVMRSVEEGDGLATSIEIYPT